MMKVNLEDFIKDEVTIENFKYVGGFFRKKEITKEIFFERLAIIELVDFARKYFGMGGAGVAHEDIDFSNLSSDIYKILKKDERNYWLKLSHIKQQSQETVMLMAGIIVSELLGKKKTQKEGKIRQSPLERYLDTL